MVNVFRLQQGAILHYKRLEISKPFLIMRSYHKHLVNKTPAEAMTGKEHKPWLEMIGYTPFQRKVA